MSSTSFEDIRQDVLSALATAHASSYVTTPLELPNMLLVDLEIQTAPWVRAELAIDKNKQFCMGATHTRVEGLLYIVTFMKAGSGTKWSTMYSDFLRTTFSLKTLNGVDFKEVIPLPGVGYPAWHAMRNRLPFSTEIYNI